MKKELQKTKDNEKKQQHNFVKTTVLHASPILLSSYEYFS